MRRFRNRFFFLHAHFLSFHNKKIWYLFRYFGLLSCVDSTQPVESTGFLSCKLRAQSKILKSTCCRTWLSNLEESAAECRVDEVLDPVAQFTTVETRRCVANFLITRFRNWSKSCRQGDFAAANEGAWIRAARSQNSRATFFVFLDFEIAKKMVLRKNNSVTE